MKLEQFKSILLTVLVLISIIFFWSLVTFQKNYELVSNQDNVKEVKKINNIKKDVKELVIPNKIIYRNDKKSYHGVQNMNAITPFMDEVRDFSFYGFQRGANEFANKFDESPDSQVLIIEFPGDIPYELLKSMYTVESKEVPNGNFRYLIIFPNDLKNDEGIAYFASTDLHSIVKANVWSSSFDNIKKLMQSINGKGPSYYAYRKKSGGYLFVAKDEITIPDEQYYPRLYDEKIFVDTLLSNPDMVTINGNEYTDGSSLLKFQNDRQMLTLVDTTVTESPASVYDMITTSINYINGHGGWTDQYYYSGAYLSSKKISFQLYTNNYPVFNESGLNELALEVGNTKIHSYKRPYFRLDFISYNPTKQDIKLPSGTTVLNNMQKDGVDLETVDDVIIGYYMYRDNEKGVVKFQPSWFYKIGNSWIRFTERMTGGIKHGLE